jgi:hypothetical protein
MNIRSINEWLLTFDANTFASNVVPPDDILLKAIAFKLVHPQKHTLTTKGKRRVFNAKSRTFTLKERLILNAALDTLPHSDEIDRLREKL